MDNNKILCILRVSTNVQDLNSQKSDMLSFITSKGYREEDIEWIESKGASARKANKKYLDFIQSIKDKTGGENGIKTVFIWHLNRLGRIKYYLTMMEHYFVQNGIQMYVKNGFDMPLLDSHGKETLGASIAFSVYASMIEIETSEMIEKMKRGKHENTRIGKYNGGKIHYGYSVDENGKLIINKEESELIKLLFKLYSSGEYSTTSLTKELQLRGYKVRGKNITLHFINSMLKSTAFIGFTEWNGIKRPYPKIISISLFNDVQQRLTNNHKGDITRASKHIHIASKLIICPNCGRKWYANSRSYVCIGHKYHKSELVGYDICDNNNSISVEWLDTAVLQVSKVLELDYIRNFTSEKKDEISRNIEINRQKIESLKDKISGLEDKKSKINELYVEGDYSKLQRDKKISILKEEENLYSSEILKLEDDNQRMEKIKEEYVVKNSLLNGELTFDITPGAEMIPNGGIKNHMEEKYNITHKHIKSVVVSEIDYDFKTQKLITITSIMGDVYRMMFIPKSKLIDKKSGRPVKLYLEVDGEFKPLLLTPETVYPQFFFLDKEKDLGTH